MSSPTVFQTAGPHVISQTIEGEVVAINLLTGSYYSLTGAAAAIWEGIGRGESASQIAASLHAGFTNCETGLEKTVTQFLEELLKESLITVADPKPAGARMTKPEGISPQKETFVRPALKKFTDMQELLLLDPVHEVDATGWPQAKAQNPGGHDSR